MSCNRGDNLHYLRFYFDGLNIDEVRSLLIYLEKMDSRLKFKRFKIQHNSFSFKQRYMVTDEDGMLIAEARTKLFSSRFKTTIYDSFGEPIMGIRKKLFSWRHVFFIDVEGAPKYRVQKTFGFKPKIFVDALDEPDAFLVQGDIWGSEFAFYQYEEEFAYVSKKMWSFKDSYGLAVREDYDYRPVIALVIVFNLIKKANSSS